jgi:alpha-tubulin suppressor-like RCC1 family protein
MGIVHLCAIDAAGAIVCWVQDVYDEYIRPYGLFTDIPTGEDFAAVAAGGQHSCALTNEGAIQCWGVDDDDDRPCVAQTYYQTNDDGDCQECHLWSDCQSTCADDPVDASECQ